MTSRRLKLLERLGGAVLELEIAEAQGLSAEQAKKRVERIEAQLRRQAKTGKAVR